MKINKLYMALTAAALGLSSNAMALTFTDGNFTGGVDIGGDITVPVAINHWQWATGDAIVLDKDVITLTNNYKTMTVPATSNLPLLVGQTKAATVGNSGSVGIKPQITLTDAAGATVHPVWDSTGNTGKGTITLPVTAADGTSALGTMTMWVKAAAVGAYEKGTGTESTIFSIYNSGANTTLPTPVSAGALDKGSLASDWCVSLGVTKTINNMLADLGTATGFPLSAFGLDNTNSNWTFADPNYFYVGSYGLGIPQGDNIVVNFTNPVSVTTQWKTALKATVTYL